MLYIEEIPRTEDAPFYTTDLEDIQTIRSWILENCNTRKRHVISKTRRGSVIAEGIKEVVYYQNGIKVEVNRLIGSHHGMKTFTCKAAAVKHYQDSKKQANLILDNKEQELLALIDSYTNSNKDISLYTCASDDDDQGLDSFIVIETTVNNLCFTRQIYI